MMKCTVLCFVYFGVWFGMTFVLGENFEFECDILERLHSLEKKANASEEVIADLESKVKASEEVIADLEIKVKASEEEIADLQSKLAKVEDALTKHLEDCPDLWVPYNGSCYMFGHQNGSSFVEAEHFCRQHDAHLVHIDDATENAFLREYLQRLNAGSFWIGMTDDVVEGVWEWYDTHTRPTFTDWYPGEPSDGNEDCAVFYTSQDFHWNDVPCSGANAPLCELRH